MNCPYIYTPLACTNSSEMVALFFILFKTIEISAFWGFNYLFDSKSERGTNFRKTKPYLHYARTYIGLFLLQVFRRRGVEELRRQLQAYFFLSSLKRLKYEIFGKFSPPPSNSLSWSYYRHIINPTGILTINAPVL